MIKQRSVTNGTGSDPICVAITCYKINRSQDIYELKCITKFPDLNQDFWLFLNSFFGVKTTTTKKQKQKILHKIG